MDFLLLALLSLSISTVFYLYYKFIKTPLEIQRHFRQQGIGGPNYNPISGNSAELQELIMAEDKSSIKTESISHDRVVQKIMPHYYFWSKVYGKQFLYWFGTKPRLAISDPDMIKEVLLNSNGLYRKARVNPLVKCLFGEGIVYSEGELWNVHRKIISQAFNMERVKDLIPDMADSTKNLVDEIEAKIGGESGFEVDIHKELNKLLADVISRTAFGSNFKGGKRIFEMQDQLAKIASDALRTVYIPGSMYLPTKKNRTIWKLERSMKEMITKIIEKNTIIHENPKALLSLLMSPYKAKGNVEKRLSLDEIVDECKTFYFAGKDSTANFLTWVFVLLGTHVEWQNKAREEVIRVCGQDGLPSAEHINSFKMITMILNESLRLYPAAPTSVREATKDLKLGDIKIPAKTQVFLVMAAVHHDRKIWGEDAQKFNPMRFAEAKKHLASHFPFGIGPRICVGQNMALVEAKVVLAMIVRKYSFVVSPSYVHSPLQTLTVQPQYGAPLIFSRVSN